MSWKIVWIFIVMALLGMALYFIPLHGAMFCFDDSSSIVDNPDIKTLDIPRIFKAFNTRFLVGLSFALNYKLFALHPFAYRLTNLLIHCINALLVYLLVGATLKMDSRFRGNDKEGRGNDKKNDVIPAPVRPSFHVGGEAGIQVQGRAVGRLEWAALFASFLFLFHPLQTEPVNFITQRFVLMGTFFYLSTLLLYIHYRDRSQKRYLFASFCTAASAMLCKEFVITLPLMLALYEFFFLGPWNENAKERLTRLIPYFIIVLIVPLLLLRTPPGEIGVADIADARIVHDGSGQKIGVDITRARSPLNRQQYFLTELNVMRTYVRLLFLPVHQNFDYDYPISHTIDIRTALSGLFLLGLLIIAVINYPLNRIISFSIFWFFIALSVESSFIPIGHVIAEYRLYLASVGFVLLVATLIYTRKMDAKKLNIVAAAILIGCLILTWQRNKVWKDELTLWNDTLSKSPHKARTYNNRGTVYSKQGKLEEALADYNKAIELDPKFPLAYFNRGVLYEAQGKIFQALDDCIQAIKINPRFAQAYYLCGTVFARNGNFDQAMPYFSRAIDLSPRLVQVYYERGQLYASKGYQSQAIADFTTAIVINPDYAGAYNNRGNVYLGEGNSSQAMDDFSKAVKLDPGLPEAHFNLGLIYNRQNNIAQALIEYTKAVEINPDSAEGYVNRGGIYVRQGKMAEALSDLNKAIEAYNNRGLRDDKQGDFNGAIADFTKLIGLNPNLPGAYYNRGSVYAKQGNWGEAMVDFTKAIAINPRYTPAYSNRVIAYVQLGKFDEAWGDAHKLEQWGATFNPAVINALKKATGREK